MSKRSLNKVGQQPGQRPGQRTLLALIGVIALGVGSCTAPASSNDAQSSDAGDVEIAVASEDSLQVVTTFLPITQFTKAVVGDRAQVTQLIPFGTGPHDYQAKPSEVQLLSQADVLVQNGLEMEEFLEDMIDNAENADLAVIDSSEGVATISSEEVEAQQKNLSGHDGDNHEDKAHGHDHGDEHHADEEHGDEHHADEEHGDEHHADEEHGDEHHADEEHGDEHHADEEHGDEHHADEEHGDEHHADEEHDAHKDVASGHHHDHGEFDPHIWLDPKRAIQQVENIRDGLIAADPEGEEVYTANAAAYIAELESLDAEISAELAPYAGQTFVSNHDFAAYFADSYDLEAEFLVGVPEENPSPEDVKNVIDIVEASNLKTLLTEPQAGQALEALATDLKVQMSTFDPLETGGEGALDPDYYLQIMRQNAENLNSAFTGTPQSWHPNGYLTAQQSWRPAIATMW